MRRLTTRIPAVLGGLFLLTVLSARPGPAAGPADAVGPAVNTFSIVAYSPEDKEWGVGVASKYLAVGAVVPWAKAGVGAIATQSFVNVSFGPDGLDLLAKGKSAEDVVAELTAADNNRDERQLAVIDARGHTARFTGSKCVAWAGEKHGTNYSCQGNLLAGPGVVEAMAGAFEEARGPLAWKIVAALEAGEKAGGDRRGRQSAAVLVVRDKGGPGGRNDRAVDFRVDDHQKPIDELGRILALLIPRP